MSTDPTTEPSPETTLFQRFLSTNHAPVADGPGADIPRVPWSPPEPGVYSFCEGSYATSYSHEHIRLVDGDGRKTGGGIRNRPLCGIDLMYGWDNVGEVDRANVSAGLLADSNSKVCPKCAGLWSIATDTPLVLG